MLPHVIEVTVRIDVDVPPDDAFAFWSDWTNNPRWQQGMERCEWTSEPPLRVGSTYDQHARMLGRPIVSSFQVVEHEPDRHLRIVTTQSTLPLDISRTVTAREDGGSTLTAVIRGEPQGPMRLLNPLMRRMVERNVTADYARLKALLESA